MQRQADLGLIIVHDRGQVFIAEKRIRIRCPDGDGLGDDVFHHIRPRRMQSSVAANESVGGLGLGERVSHK